MEQACRNAIARILNHWTALRLAVEHSMGGPQSKQLALHTIDYLTSYLCNAASIEVEDIEDVLEDIMEKEFNTICEDNSVKEVALLMYKCVNFAKDGKLDEIEAEFNNLPLIANWLQKSSNISVQDDDTDSDDVTMDQSSSSTSGKQGEMEDEIDPEWTTVRNRRRN